jgi:hypothetical protein
MKRKREREREKIKKRRGSDAVSRWKSTSGRERERRGGEL